MRRALHAHFARGTNANAELLLVCSFLLCVAKSYGVSYELVERGRLDHVDCVLNHFQVPFRHHTHL